MQLVQRNSGRIRHLIVAMVVALLASSCVLGPINGPGNTNVPVGFDLADVGFEESEFFLAGAAQSYGSAQPLSSDGKWTVSPDDAKALFLTRMIVRKPIDPFDFNGTVVVEWMNVTAGTDLPNDWTMAHNEFTRRGYAWVGVSAQAVGVNAAVNQNPDRYGALTHPGDSYSYDMFTQAGEAIIDDPVVLGGLPVQRMIATGESQSASRLVTYINGIHPTADVFDGYLVHSRGTGGSSLRQSPLESIVTPRPTLIRNDLDVPVMVVQAEDDVIRSDLAIRQPDTSLFRMWEMAGTAHADSYTLNGSADVGDGALEILMFGFMRDPQNSGCANPINAGSHYLTLQAAFAATNAWIRTGTPPPLALPLQADSTGPTVLTRNHLGIAEGGVRTPHVDVPVARLDGLNSGPSFCRLFGSTTPLTTAQLSALYPTNAHFVAAWTDSVDAAVNAGFILPADRDNLVAAAANSTVPN